MRIRLLLLCCGLAACGPSAPPPSTPVPEDGVTRGDETRDDGTATEATVEEIPALYRCEVPSDCALTYRTCCGRCGAARRGDAMAVSAARLPYEVVRPECNEPLSGCPACAADHDPGLAASCVAHRCEVIDLSVHALSACTADADCAARRRGCCGCDGDDVAMSSAADTEFRALFCAPGERCLETCTDRPEGSPTASCVEGHCRLPLEVALRER